MRYLTLGILVLISLLTLTSCQDQEEASPTAVPLTVTTVLPTEEPTPTEVPATVPTDEVEPTEAAPTEETVEVPPSLPSLIGQQTERLRPLDFSPFEEAMANFGEDRAAAVEAIVLDATIPDIQAAMEAGELTSEEFTLFFLSNIQQYDESLRSYTEINPNALDEARAADELRAQGTVLGPLHGIPINLKDNIGTTAPLHTTGGAEILLDHVPANDAPLVSQLREAGAVILGKANLSELAGGVALYPAGYSAVAGQTINPYGATFPTLGSSSGSAASTAAFLTMASVGSETGGSLIAPASLNGVVGMYPTDDLVNDEGVIPLVSSTDTPGPIARTVTDAAILLDSMDTAAVGYATMLDANALDGITAGFLIADLIANPGLGLSQFEDTTDQEEKLQLIGDSLESAGATLVIAEIVPVGGLLASDDLLQLLYGPGLASQGITDLSELDEETRAALQKQAVKTLMAINYFSPLLNGGLVFDMVGYLADSGAPVATLADLQAYNREMPERRIANGQYQIDSTALLAESIDRGSYEQLAEEGQQVAASALDATFAAYDADVLVSMVNEHSTFYALAGYPAVTVPLGLRANGAPTGVTFIGKPGQDAQLLAYAYAFEQATMLRQDPDLEVSIQEIGSYADTSAGMGEAALPQGISGQETPCELILPPTEIEGETVVCGQIVVPENWSDPNNKTVTISYVKWLSDNPQPDNSPLIFFEGVLVSLP